MRPGDLSIDFSGPQACWIRRIGLVALGALGALLSSTALADLGATVTHSQPPQISGEGKLEVDSVLKVLKAHQRVLQACFERELLRGVDIDGKLVLTWRILPDGTVAGARAIDHLSTVKNAGVTSCIAQQIMKWKFPRPAGGEVSVRHALVARKVETPPGFDRDLDRRTTHSDPPLGPEPSEKFKPRHHEPCSVSSGALDLPAFNAILQKRHAQLQACLGLVTQPPRVAADAGALARALDQLSPPSPHPPSRVEWTVSPAGTLTGVRVTRGAVRQSKAEACLRQHLPEWSVPRHAGGDTVATCTFLIP